MWWKVLLSGFGLPTPVVWVRAVTASSVPSAELVWDIGANLPAASALPKVVAAKLIVAESSGAGEYASEVPRATRLMAPLATA